MLLKSLDAGFDLRKILVRLRFAPFVEGVDPDTFQVFLGTRACDYFTHFGLLLPVPPAEFRPCRAVNQRRFLRLQ